MPLNGEQRPDALGQYQIARRVILTQSVLHGHSSKLRLPLVRRRSTIDRPSALCYVWRTRLVGPGLRIYLHTEPQRPIPYSHLRPRKRAR